MVRVLRIVPFALVLVLGVAVCSTALAQPGGGRGPMGGGMFNASPSMMYSMLLNSPTVQKDLGLVDEQKTKLKELSDKNRAAMRELFSNGGNFQDMTDEERAEFRKKMQAQGEKNSKDVLAVLLPDQVKRLKEISVQQMGVMALADKDVQKELKMTDDQVAKLKTVADDMGKKVREIFSAGPGGDRDEMRQKMQDLRKEGEQKALEVLTADQKTAFEKMKGKKIEIPASEMRGGMGRGGRRGGGGGGGGGGNRPTD